MFNVVFPEAMFDDVNYFLCSSPLIGSWYVSHIITALSDVTDQNLNLFVPLTELNPNLHHNFQLTRCFTYIRGKRLRTC